MLFFMMGLFSVDIYYYYYYYCFKIDLLYQVLSQMLLESLQRTGACTKPSRI